MKAMKYTTVDGMTITGCPVRPDRHVGGFLCVLCEHWRGPGRFVSGGIYGDAGIKQWEVPCEVGNSDMFYLRPIYPRGYHQAFKGEVN